MISFTIDRRAGKNELLLSLAGIKKALPDQKEKRAFQTQPRSKKKRPLADDILVFLNRQLLSGIITLLRKLLRALHLDLNISGLYGFADPSLTGIVAATMAAIDFSNHTLYLYPDFSRSVLDIDGTVQGRFIPLQLLAIAIAFLFQKPVRAIWWPKINFIKKKNNKEAVKYA